MSDQLVLRLNLHLR